MEVQLRYYKHAVRRLLAKQQSLMVVFVTLSLDTTIHLITRLQLVKQRELLKINYLMMKINYHIYY